MSSCDVKPLRFVDRSRIVKDWTCPRARFLGYEWGGRGLATSNTSLELWLGISIHDALAAIARADAATVAGAGIDQIASAAQRQVYDALSQVKEGEIPDPDTLTFAEEQAALVDGLVRGFHRHVWPRLIPAGWKIICVEHEVQVTLADGLIFMAKPDLIISDPEDNWWYVEYKSTSSKKSQWIDSWNTAVQLHSSIKAVEATLGHPVVGVIVQGLYKGYESYGRQNSPFCYAYVRSGNPPFTPEAVRYDYAAGFRRQPTWERPGGVAQWVREMPDDQLAEQFPSTPPIFVKDELLTRFLAQTTLRELEIAEAVRSQEHPRSDDHRTWEQILDQTFPQHFEACQPAWGRGCEFKRICHSRVDNPLEQGYVYRQPHHVPEMEQQAAGGGDS